MSRLTSIASAPWRLAKALRRHGLGPIAVFLFVSLRRHGVTEAVRLAAASRRERAQITAGAIRQIRPLGPTDLDHRYGLSATAWNRWRPWVGVAPSNAESLRETVDDAAVCFVIEAGGAEDADKLARTETAIRRLPKAQIHVARRGEAAAWPAGPVERFFVFLKAGDIPAPEFARELARAARRGITDVVSFDMARRDGDTVYLLLLPGANPTLLAEVDYLFSRVALRGEALSETAGAAAQDPRQAVLGWLVGRPATQVRGRWRHVGRPLVEIALSAEDIARQRDEVLRAGRAPVARAHDQSVSVVICTQDTGRELEPLVRSLQSYPSGAIAEIAIVATASFDPNAHRSLCDLAATPGVTVSRHDGPCNSSKLANLGARGAARGSHLLFMNEDVAPASQDWLDRLLSRFSDPEVAAAGPLLLDPDGRIEQAGMYLGFHNFAGHTLRGAALPEEDYLFTGVAPRETSCLDGAALLVARSAFEAVNGFDEQLSAPFQGVDLCLRFQRIGLRNVFDPTAVLIYTETTPAQTPERRSTIADGADVSRFQARWRTATRADRFHPAGFHPDDERLHHLSGADGARPPMRGAVPRTPPR
jgi:GT2 family glycosyltransferase